MQFTITTNSSKNQLDRQGKRDSDIVQYAQAQRSKRTKEYRNMNLATDTGLSVDKNKKSDRSVIELKRIKPNNAHNSVYKSQRDSKPSRNHMQHKYLLTIYSHSDAQRPSN